MARSLVAANWKMNGSLAGNRALVGGVLAGVRDLSCEVVLCVPHPYLAQVGGLLEGGRIGLGGQDVSAHEAGAYTGEVSAGMLCDVGCSHVVVGHSERRKYHGESDALVLAKVRRALDAGLVPILCVGESREQRESGATDRVVLAQVESVFGGLADVAARKVVVAYEPIWAIGTGKVPTTDQIGEVHDFIRDKLVARFGAEGEAIRVLYGGSVKPSNAAEIFAVANVDGALVGGASLKAADFSPIIAALETAKG